MSPPNVWGPPVWTLFHCLSVSIKDDVSFLHLRKSIFQNILSICKNLPCPFCAQDASLFLGKINIETIKTKQEFINMLYLFHNYVNKKTNKQLFNSINMSKYNNYNLINVINRFIKAFNTKGNMNLINESFQRQLVIKNFRQWIHANINHFIINK